MCYVTFHFVPFRKFSIRVSLQAGMRDSLNASNGMNRPGSIVNGSADLQLPPTRLGDRTVITSAACNMKYSIYKYI